MDAAEENQNANQQAVPNQHVQTVPNLEICRVSVKPPPFCKEQPDLFFIQMESQFAISGVTADSTMYHQVIASLEPQYIANVADIVRNPPQLNKYDAIKAALIAEYTDSDDRKLAKLIHEMQLGDLKPSQLLRRMKDLAGTKISEHALKILWLEHLPDTVRAIISISEDESTKIALQADKIMETQRRSTISAVQANNHNALQAEIEELRKELQRFKSISPNKSSTRTYAKSPTRSTFCYYHDKFGAKARKCTEPCDFIKHKSEN